MKKLELLAPAGNILKMRTALSSGADAVYLGIPDFSLRVRINDFTLESLEEAIKEVHAQNKKVYVTLNIFAHNQHVALLPPYIKKIKSFGPDGLIISDPGVMATVKKIWPEAEIHLSTQANCTNAAAAKFWYDQGVTRVVLGREVTLNEIKEIHQVVPKLELEYFVHGAMCMAYSGRCFLSKELVDRSGNLGDCAQPCRWEYSIKARNHEEEFDLVEESHGTYLLNSKDLCLLEYLPQLIEAGIVSFKIEGRAKSVYYQAVVSGIYARALELLKTRPSEAVWKKELKYLKSELASKLVHRGYTSGFLLGGKAEQNLTSANHLSDFEFCGQVIKAAPDFFKPVLKNGEYALYFQVHNTIKTGDQVEIIGPKYAIIKISPKKIFDAQTGEALLEAHGGGGSRTALIIVREKIGVLSVLRRKII
ncbi:MAG: peptidase U32 family protein [Candidatus Falkowbacteria bacterium]